jgi:hypothetical protein
MAFTKTGIAFSAFIGKTVLLQVLILAVNNCIEQREGRHHSVDQDVDGI